MANYITAQELHYSERRTYENDDDYVSTTIKYYIYENDGQSSFSMSYDAEKFPYISNYTYRLRGRFSEISQIIYNGVTSSTEFAEVRIGIWLVEDGIKEGVFKKIYSKPAWDNTETIIDTSDIDGEFYVGLFFTDEPDAGTIKIDVLEKKSHLSKSGYEGCVIPRKVDNNAPLTPIYIDAYGRICIKAE